MKISNLEDQVFYGFVSKKIKFNPDIHEHEFIRGTDSIRLRIYLGGENEDVRAFNFKDYECAFLDGRLHKVTKPTAEWVKYLVANTELGFDDEYIAQWNSLVKAKIDETVASLNEDLIS